MTTDTVWNSVTYGDGEFVALSQSGSIFDYSTNGITWSSTNLGVGASSFTTIAYGDGVFVALGNDGGTGVAWYSTNGINWTQTTIPVAGVASVTYADGEFVGVAQNTASGVVSTNGITWTPTTLESNDAWNQVAYANGEFVTVNWNDSTYDYSSNGTTWVASTFPGSYDGGGVVAADGGFISFDDEGDYYTSTNGTNWTEGSYGTGSFNLGNGVATNGSTVVVVPYGGTQAEIFTEALATQSINVTSTTGTVNQPLSLTAGGYSGSGAITFAIADDYGTATGCSVTSGVLTATSTGTCDVTASIAADTQYAAATSSPTAVTIGLASQSINVSSTSGTFNTPLTLTSSGYSGSGAITYTVTSGTATGCSIASGTLTSTDAGTCLVTAQIAADSEYAAASSSPTTVTLGPASQSITVASTSGTFNTPLTLASSGYSGSGSITYTVTSGTATGCSIASGILSSTDAGTCLVTAHIAASANYSAAQSAATTVTLALASQLITVTSTSGTVNHPLTLTAGGYSGSGAITFAIADDYGTATGCSVTSGVLSATSTGTCDVVASIGADSDYASATSAPTAVAFGLASQSIYVASTSGTFNTPLTLTSSGYSGAGAITYTVTNGTATGCSISSGVLTTSGAGTCVVTAHIAADADYSAASSSATTVTLSRAAQIVTVTSTSGASWVVGLHLTSSGYSGTGAITYAVANGTATGCSITSGVLTASSAGTCLVTAQIAADANYNAAQSAATTVTLSLASQSITVTSTSGTSFETGLTLTAGGYAGAGAITFTVTNGTATGCSITTGVLTAGGAGTCDVTAHIAGDANYSAAQSSATLVALGLAAQTITVTTTSGTFNTPLVLASDGYTGSGVITYNAVDGTATGCTASAGTLTSSSAGTCVVTASIAADATYTSATSSPVTVTFGLASQSINVTSTSGTAGQSLTLTAGEYTGTGAVTFTVTDGTATDCVIASGALSASGSGTCVVTAAIAADSNYLEATSAATTVTFTAAPSSGGGGGGGGGSTPPPTPPTSPTPPVPPVSPPVPPVVVGPVQVNVSGTPSRSEELSIDTKDARVLVCGTEMTLEKNSGSAASVLGIVRNAREGGVLTAKTKSGAAVKLMVTKVSKMSTDKALPASLFAKCGAHRIVIVTVGGTYNAATKHWSEYIITVATVKS
jgi:hypothetical protein